MSYRISRRQFLKVSSLTTLGGLIAGCAPATSAPAAQPTSPVKPSGPTATPAPKPPTGTLNLNNGSEPNLLDPRIVDSTGWSINRLLFRPVIMFEKNSAKLVPGLAESWTTSPDGKEYSFKLRKGVKFHKGYGELTSEDVKFSITSCQEPATKSLWKSTADYISEIRTPDPYTVTIILKEPMASFPMQLVNKMGYIVSKKAVTELGEKHLKEPIGTGPFMLEKWEPKGSITLVANPDFYEAGTPRVAKVVYRFIFEKATELMSFMAGELDVISEISYENYKRLQEMKDKYAVYQIPVAAVTHIEINTKIAPLDKLEVRQAIAHAIDYDSVNKACGDWVRTNSHLTPAFASFKKDFPPAYPYNIDKAKELLAKAGFPNGIDIELWGSQGGYHEIMDTAIEASWRKAGIRAKVNYQSNAIMTTKRRAGECQTWSDKWVRAPEEDLMWWDKFHSTMFSEGKHPFYGVNEMLEAGRKETDPKKRSEIYQKLDNFVSYETAQSIPIGIETRYSATQLWVKEYFDNGLDYGWAVDQVVTEKK